MIKSVVRTTVALRADVLEQVDAVVRDGEAANRSALIDLAIRRYLWDLEQERIDDQIRRAAADPANRKIGDEIMREFAAADDEAWALARAEHEPGR